MNKVKTKTSWMSFQNLLFKNVIYLLTKLAWMNVFFTSIVLDLQKDTLRYIQHIVINKHMLLRCLRSPVFTDLKLLLVQQLSMLLVLWWPISHQVNTWKHCMSPPWQLHWCLSVQAESGGAWTSHAVKEQ